ncbi:hypothetical protein PSA5_03960, partial [Pseudomonas syringae pv. actinidiae]
MAACYWPAVEYEAAFPDAPAVGRRQVGRKQVVARLSAAEAACCSSAGECAAALPGVPAVGRRQVGRKQVVARLS